jgi:uncharacterized protein (TIGR03067 family)
MKISLSLASLFLVAGASADSEQVQAEKRHLQGTWKVIAAEGNGEAAPPKEIEEMEIIFKGDSIQVREGNTVQERFTYKLDIDKTPRAIDFTFTEGKKKGRTDRGIYLLEGDNLKICIQENKDKPRPKEFTTRAGTDLSLVVLRRLK